MPTRRRSAHLLRLWLAGLFALVVASGPAGGDQENRLADQLGRAESRIFSAPYRILAGGTVAEYGLAERLERLGYERVKSRPDRAGQFFWGHRVFWIYRQAHDLGRRRHDSRLFALDLDPSEGRVLSARDADDLPLDLDAAWIEPELLAAGLDDEWAPGVPIRLADLPETVWRPVLAAEDARFFDHVGVDGRSLARAALANLQAGKVAQGGSTITQQLIKNRDLTPKRTFGRKASEAMRSLAIEASYTKEEILEAYLDQVYLGHVDGLAIHGIGTAARTYFSKSAAELSLAQAATLAAMIQGPNRLAPDRHPDRARERRNWVLDRMAELGWADGAAVESAKNESIRLRPTAPDQPLGRHFRRWLRDLAREQAGRRLEKGRGVVIESTLDPLLQKWAEEETSLWAAKLRSKYRHLRRDGDSDPLGLALVALDAETGAVLAHVGGDPSRGGDFDRARQARRQPGSALKPLLLLEAFEECGGQTSLHPATRVADEPLRLDLPSGPWSPTNSDGEFRGVVTIREALRQSLNLPFVRLGRHCGERPMARRLRRAGLDLPEDAPPAFLLGAIETTPLDLAGAYAALANGGRAVEPYPATRIEKPSGRGLEKFRPDLDRVSDAASAFLVHSLLVDAVENGTGRSAAIDGLVVAAKTGTSSDRRDAWLAGQANGIVTVVWVGRDDGGPLGASGSSAAGPLWKAFMAKAAKARPPRRIERPSGVLTHYVDPKSGLLVRSFRPGAEPELFHRSAVPRRNRFWRDDEPEPVIR